MYSVCGCDPHDTIEAVNTLQFANGYYEANHERILDHQRLYFLEYALPLDLWTETIEVDFIVIVCEKRGSCEGK